jgi:fatty acid desaturase
MRHHAHTNTANDLPTDLEKHEVTDLRDMRLYAKLFRDLSGVTAVHSFFGHNTRKDRSIQAEPLELSKKLGRGWRLVVAQAFVLAIVFQFHVVRYLFFWIVPLLTFNMLLLRIRGIAEHGLPGQLAVPIATADEGNFFTRSALTPMRAPRSRVLRTLESALIGSLSCNFHHEHHLYPNVPFYNLRRLHERIASEVDRYNPDVYVESYLVAFLMGRRA